jgi:hypothetical protein
VALTAGCLSRAHALAPGRGGAAADRLHDTQSDFCAAGGDTALRLPLTPDIAWTVPGDSPVAGQFSWPQPFRCLRLPG